MAIDINKVIIIGRLTRDPEIRTLPSGTAVAKFGIAVNRKYSVNNETKEEVSFFNCVVWGKMTEIIRQYCQKGKQVAIEGRLHQNRWQDAQSGQNKSVVEIVVENLQLLGSRGSEDGESKSYADSGSKQGISENPPEASMPESPDMLDDDIPF
jgi:single-strand DNA-binding protein